MTILVVNSTKTLFTARDVIQVQQNREANNDFNNEVARGAFCWII